MTIEKSLVSGLTGRYAIALFDLARSGDAMETVAADLDRLDGMLAESLDLKRLVNSPVSGRDDQQKAVIALAQAAGFHQLTSNLLGVLAQNRRLPIIPDLVRDFRVLRRHERGESTAHVTTARALNEQQTQALSDKLRVAMGRDVAVEADVDESLLGGLVVRIGSRMIDSSIRTKLNSLEIAMKGSR